VVVEQLPVGGAGEEHIPGREGPGLWTEPDSRVGRVVGGTVEVPSHCVPVLARARMEHSSRDLSYAETSEQSDSFPGTKSGMAGVLRTTLTTAVLCC